MNLNLLVENVYGEIKERILSGEYLPGTHLVEGNLTDEFNISRVTMRDALRRLVADELVILVPNKGVYVRQTSYREVLDLFVVRESIEGLAARIAAESPVKSSEELQAIYLEEESQLNKSYNRELNYRFHMEIAAMTGNMALMKTLERLYTQVLQVQVLGYRNLLIPQAEHNQIAQHGHKEVLEAICARDGDRAEKAIRQHLKAGLEFTLSCIPNE